MSRSRRKTPVAGWTTARSEKFDKKIIHRKMRRKVDKILKTIVDPEDIAVADFPITDEIKDVWSMQKDGKCSFEWMKNDPRWVETYNKLMRK